MSRWIHQIPAAIVMVGMFLLSAPDASAVLYSRITASTMDSQGNTYVTGWRVIEEKYTPTWEYIADIVTIKYDKYGNEVWADNFPKDSGWPPNPNDAEGWAITVDRFGNVYVAGHVGSSGGGTSNVDCVLLKYGAGTTPGSGPEWVRTIAGVSNQDDQLWNATVDADGSVYVTGYIRQPNASIVAGDMLTVKYEPDGDEAWRAVYNGPDNLSDVGVSLVVDPVRRNVFVTGYSYHRTSPTAARPSMITIMYDASGIEQWVRRYDGPVNSYNRGVSLTLDPEGSVYVSGWSRGVGSLDFATVKYDLEGNEKWVARYDGPAGGSDQAAPYALWALGGSSGFYLQSNLGIHVTPEIIDPEPAIDYLMERLKAAGLHHGHQNSLLSQLGVVYMSLSSPRAVIRRSAANVMLAFVKHVEALRMEGNISESAAVEFTDIGTHIRKGILKTPTNVVYVLGQSTGVDTDFDIALLKYNGETGRPMWNLPGQPGTAPGKPGAPADIAFRIDGAWHSVDRGMAMALNADGELYVTGMITDASYVPTYPQAVDSLTARLSVNTYRPAILAQHKYDGAGLGTDTPCTLATWQDPDTGRRTVLRDPVLGDLVVISGNSALTTAPNLPQHQYFTIMYDSNLMLRWFNKYD